MDVQHPALAGLTAHPSMTKMEDLLKDYPNQNIKENAPNVNREAIKADMVRLSTMRFLYRKYETPYNRELIEAMRPSRVPGGASSTLRDIKDLESNIEVLTLIEVYVKQP